MENKENMFYWIISGLICLFALILLANYLIYSDILVKINQVNRIVVLEYTDKLDSLQKKQLLTDAKLTKYFLDTLEVLKSENRVLQKQLKLQKNCALKLDTEKDSGKPKLLPLKRCNSAFKYGREGVIE